MERCGKEKGVCDGGAEEKVRTSAVRMETT